jgi:hypothetical protein
MATQVEAKTVSRDLIPTNGVHITKSCAPAGFYVARYDSQGFTSNGRWFPTLDHAREYAERV